MKVVFSERAWAQYRHWTETDPKVVERLNRLIEECSRHPFSGAGKPEPLKGEMKGSWSRRLTDEDRLVYRVSGRPPNQQSEIVQCRYHY